MSKKTETLKYIFFDLIAAILSWSFFFYFRKKIEEKSFEIDDSNFLFGILFVLTLWLVIYICNGRYNNVFRASRLQTFYSTFIETFIGCIIIFFAIIIDDIKQQGDNYFYYYYSISILFTIHFSITFSFRYIFNTIIISKIKSRKIGFNTLLIGSSEKAYKIYKYINNMPTSTGTNIVGYIQTKFDEKDNFDRETKKIDSNKKFEEILIDNKIEEAIIAINTKNSEHMNNFLYELNYNNIITKIVPENSDMISGKIKMESILSPDFIEILPDSMKNWEKITKRLIDFFGSLFLLIILFPFFVIISILVKMSSKGPIFYSQERIGLNKKPFNIIKFRSMYLDSEKQGIPMLTKENDTRITKWGKIMRKYRIDELPQFYNVLIGEMSFVGPRPERKYFIEKILPLAPHYKLIFKFKPGITSWGMVKYGYADDVNKMIDRLKFDIIYIKNLSIFNDIKVIAYTIIIILQGRGK